MSKYDLIVIGSGLSGSIIARKLAQDRGKKVLILEKRNHIGGNVYDEKDTYGIRIQKYGPHTFHTNNKRTYEFMKQFAEMLPYRIKCCAMIDGILTPSPCNFTTVEQFYEATKAAELIQRLKRAYKQEQVSIVELLNSRDALIQEYASFLYEKDYKLYTAKQWGIEAEKIDLSVLKRVPILLSYRDHIYIDQYEAIPQNGFTSLVHNILDHGKIDIELERDGLEKLEINEDAHVILFGKQVIPIIFTGAIDELFGYKYGKLPYRSLEIKYEYYNLKEKQKTALVVYPQEKGFTRSTEYTKLPDQMREGKTVIGREYPCEYQRGAEKGNEPYYPSITKESMKLYEKYKIYAKQFKNLTLCGRLADYKYYNMDQAVENALKVYDEMGIE